MSHYDDMKHEWHGSHPQNQECGYCGITKTMYNRLRKRYNAPMPCLVFRDYDAYYEYIMKKKFGDS